MKLAIELLKSQLEAAKKVAAVACQDAVFSVIHSRNADQDVHDLQAAVDLLEDHLKKFAPIPELAEVDFDDANIDLYFGTNSKYSK